MSHVMWDESDFATQLMRNWNIFCAESARKSRRLTVYGVSEVHLDIHLHYEAGDVVYGILHHPLSDC